ncbi:hypothetical protein O6H91_08G037500 [Diphasiastrum complanatum]|uniref:Uncharacterized protein n=2 Tax=Diphasiastrum complanatum TaxID=34168 RepID=A0ACC2CWH6_DIPCM|nr:hypothetical protein O6H91_08G037200 [Diphasiastrum complanatum]KAJ7546366.1 hypothetical protein O6H91_08G037500 [Diphasiastrum complanatum]
MMQLALITAAVLLFITSIAACWRKSSNSGQMIDSLHGAQLPKGSWSIPWIGESFTLYNQGPYQFYSQHIARYGRTFRTHLMGIPTIVTSTPEAAKFVLATRQKLFLVFLPPSISRLLSVYPASQDAMKETAIKTIRDSLHSELVRNKVAKVDRIARWVLSSWDKQPCVITYQETKKFAFHVALDAITGMAPSPETMKMMDDFSYINKGMGTSMQFNIPGTSYHMALKKRQQVLESFSCMVKKRRSEKSNEKCTLDFLMETEDENGEKLPDDQLQSQLLGLTFGGFDTSAAFFMWLLKLLGENQQILQQVKAEQDTIRMGKISPEDPLSWTDIVNMPYSSTVIQETLRLASVVPFLTRQATEDVIYEGVRIPKGWLVQVCLQNFHVSPEYHKEPLKFDPSRFQAPVKPAGFMPFGNGAKMCPGRELVKIEALVFLHYLVTTYSWENIGSKTRMNYWPSPTVKGGLPIKVSKLREDAA